MTSLEAQDQITSAIENLKTVRDSVGEQLAQGPVSAQIAESEARRLLDLHDRVARAIQAYY